MTKHLVFGAGLIGCYLGGVLNACRKSDDHVDFYVRPNMASKLTQGLTLSDYQNNHLSLPQISALTDINDCVDNVEYDFIWLTVKCISVVDAINSMKPFVTPKTVIVCCQNGLGSEIPVTAAFPENLVLRAMVPFNVTVDSDNHFHRGSEGHFTIESSIHDNRLWLAFTKDNVNSGGADAILPVSFTAEMTAMQWAKLQLNLGNSVNALANIPVKSMLEQRQYRLVIAEMMRELLRVTDALGISLPKVTSIPAHWIPRVLSLPNFLFQRVANKMLTIDPTVRTSMWWDMQQGRKTEIDFLNGVVVNAADKLSISCKVNQYVIEKVKITEAQDKDERQSYSAEQFKTELE